MIPQLGPSHSKIVVLKCSSDLVSELLVGHLFREDFPLLLDWIRNMLNQQRFRPDRRTKLATLLPPKLINDVLGDCDHIFVLDTAIIQFVCDVLLQLHRG